MLGVLHIHLWIYLDVNAASQTSATLKGLLTWMTVPPILLLVVGIAIYRRYYKLDDKKMHEIMVALRPDEYK